MKVGPNADYPVRVLRQEWEEEVGPELYVDIFAVSLNLVVDISFVPDVSAAAPPFEDVTLPADLDNLSTVQQARLVRVLLSSYAVTPNAVRAGTVDQFRWRDEPVVVRYVAPAEYDRYAVDLDRLTDVVGSLHPYTTVSDLRGFEVVRFLEAEIVPAPWLRPWDAEMLAREPR